MNRDEKYKNIIAKINIPETLTQTHLSILMIVDYMRILFANGIINDEPVKIQEGGSRAIAICNEFEWEPTDEEIASFCRDMVEEAEITVMFTMLKCLRDDKDKFLENAKKHIGY